MRNSILILTILSALTGCGGSSSSENTSSDNKSVNWLGSWTGMNPSAEPTSASFIFNGDSVTDIMIDRSNLLTPSDAQGLPHSQRSIDENLYIDIELLDDDHAILAISDSDAGFGDFAIAQKEGLPNTANSQSINGSWIGQRFSRKSDDSVGYSEVLMTCINLRCALALSPGDDTYTITFEFGDAVWPEIKDGLWVEAESVDGPFLNFAISPDEQALAGTFCHEPYVDYGDDLLDACYYLFGFNRAD